jgi:hypothetical protein
VNTRKRIRELGHSDLFTRLKMVSIGGFVYCLPLLAQNLNESTSCDNRTASSAHHEHGTGSRLALPVSIVVLVSILVLAITISIASLGLCAPVLSIVVDTGTVTERRVLVNWQVPHTAAPLRT